MGAFNGLAFDSHQTWAFWRAEAVGVAESPFRCANGTRATMLSARTLPPRLWGVERMMALVDGALGQLEAPLSGFRGDARLSLWLGLPERYGPAASRERASERRRMEGHVKQWCERSAGGAPVIGVPRGHASLAWALAEACAEVAAGRLEAALVGGVDTYHAPEVMDELMEQARLFDGENMDSLIPGEGAAFLLVTRSRAAKGAGLPLLARVEAVGLGQEPGSLFSDVPCTGAGLTQAMRAATALQSASGRRLEWLLGDVNNESYRVAELQLALPRALAPGGMDGGKDFRPVAVDELPIDFLPLRFGDLGAATLPTAAVIASQAFVRGAPSASNCLCVGSSVGPDRGAVLLSSMPVP
jgi:3-oxoacyl-[acyl-carrier-protein] synthase-1